MKQLENTLTLEQKTILDYILMEYLTVDESNNVTLEKLNGLILLIQEEWNTINWKQLVVENPTNASKKFCKILSSYILEIVK
jgi:hypothetical protein